MKTISLEQIKEYIQNKQNLTLEERSTLKKQIFEPEKNILLSDNPHICLEDLVNNWFIKNKTTLLIKLFTFKQLNIIDEAIIAYLLEYLRLGSITHNERIADCLSIDVLFLQNLILSYSTAKDVNKAKNIARLFYPKTKKGDQSPFFNILKNLQQIKPDTYYPASLAIIDSIFMYRETRPIVFDVMIEYLGLNLAMKSYAIVVRQLLKEEDRDKHHRQLITIAEASLGTYQNDNLYGLITELERFLNNDDSNQKKLAPLAMKLVKDKNTFAFQTSQNNILSIFQINQLCINYADKTSKNQIKNIYLQNLSDKKIESGEYFEKTPGITYALMLEEPIGFYSTFRSWKWSWQISDNFSDTLKKIICQVPISDPEKLHTLSSIPEVSTETAETIFLRSIAIAKIPFCSTRLNTVEYILTASVKNLNTSSERAERIMSFLILLVVDESQTKQSLVGHVLARCCSFPRIANDFFSVIRENMSELLMHERFPAGLIGLLHNHRQVIANFPPKKTEAAPLIIDINSYDLLEVNSNNNNKNNNNKIDSSTSMVFWQNNTTIINKGKNQYFQKNKELHNIVSQKLKDFEEKITRLLHGYHLDYYKEIGNFQYKISKNILELIRSLPEKNQVDLFKHSGNYIEKLPRIMITHILEEINNLDQNEVKTLASSIYKYYKNCVMSVEIDFRRNYDEVYNNLTNNSNYSVERIFNGYLPLEKSALIRLKSIVSTSEFKKEEMLPLIIMYAKSALVCEIDLIIRMINSTKLSRNQAAFFRNLIFYVHQLNHKITGSFLSNFSDRLEEAGKYHAYLVSSSDEMLIKKDSFYMSLKIIKSLQDHGLLEFELESEETGQLLLEISAFFECSDIASNQCNKRLKMEFFNSHENNPGKPQQEHKSQSFSMD